MEENTIIIVPFLLYVRSVNQNNTAFFLFPLAVFVASDSLNQWVLQVSLIFQIIDKEKTGSTDRCDYTRYGKLEYQFLDTFCDDGPLTILVVSRNCMERLFWKIGKRWFLSILIWN